MALNAQEFKRRSEDLFASSYLTSLGITQSVALGGLVAVSFLGTAPITRLVGMQMIGSFLVILLIVTEYSWWILLVRRTPTLLDTLIPYILSFVELASISFVSDQKGMWPLSTGLIGGVSVLAYLYSRSSCTVEVFRECSWLRPLTIRTIERNATLVVLMSAILLLTTLTWKYMDEVMQNSAYIAFYALAISVFVLSHRFLGIVAARFESEHP